MEHEEKSLPDTINHNNFPAKLWVMANDPTNGAVSWSSSGEGLVIDQSLFESQILSPHNTFKTANFTSIVRQLNLYGFKKKDMPTVTNDSTSTHFYDNPNFKRGHPELLVNLKRLTVSNKARLEAGLEVNVRLGREGMGGFLKRKISSTPSPLPSKNQATNAQRGTPVPPRYLMRGDIGASSWAFVPSQPIPLSQSPLCPMHSHPILPTQIKNGNPHFFRGAPWHAHYRPGCNPSVCHSHHSHMVSPNGPELPTLLSPQSNYRVGYQVNILDFGQDSQHNKNQDVKKTFNFEAIFQRADEFMPTSPSTVAVKVESTAEVSVSDVPRENNSSSATANAPAPNILPLQKKLVTSVPELMLGDHLVEDAEIICVDLPETSGDFTPE
ncbi:heat shock factor protein 5 [Nothobranchius furzeri]|uniref:Transcript variant X1 n=2 Tax=Nothobranchius furzeri TaxID=105023 RepID=A0A8C6LSR2_NOTFU|nr:transcript variant X2 [Nothobranchius furzeri]KAF7206616.1 transcript variant X1 [Nothobranchius furzeri]KAF7206617.1 transcript variant X3 [Nothobranchius furzeri]